MKVPSIWRRSELAWAVDAIGSGGRAAADQSSDPVPSLVRALARLGCTRIGSPGIFGV